MRVSLASAGISKTHIRCNSRPVVTARAAAPPAMQNPTTKAPKKPEARPDGNQARSTAAAKVGAKPRSSLPAAALEGTNLFSMDDYESQFTVEDLLTA